MGIQNLRQSLRWWKPYVAVEYRKLSEEEEAGSESWGWVRATAVLARAKEDDMPDTAVYVAHPRRSWVTVRKASWSRSM